MSEVSQGVYVKRTQKDYSQSFKLQVVQEIEQGLSTVSSAKRKYGIQGEHTVTRWLEKFSIFAVRTKVFQLCVRVHNKSLALEQRCRLLEKQKTSLEKQLEDSDTKSIIFDMMIDLAEQGVQDSDKKKPLARTIERFCKSENRSISQACGLFGLSRQAYYRKHFRRIFQIFFVCQKKFVSLQNC
jgi:transposase-like protein